MTAAERLMAKVVKDSVTGCWQWTGATRTGGYSAFRYEGRTTSGHRAAYQIYVGTIPEGLQLDHLCRNRACVNPAHLEPVTAAENNRRGFGWSGIRSRRTHCPQGHPYDETNTYRRPGSSGRECRKCRCAVVQRNKAAKR